MRCFFLIIALLGIRAATAQQTTIPLGGNAWGDTVWFRLSHTGRLDIALQITPTDTPTTISVTLNSTTHALHLPAHSDRSTDAHWIINDTGYQHVIVKAPAQLAIQSLLLSGPAADSPMAYVPNNDGNFFYWGRRGPSVHLNYPIADNQKVAWFYSELTVPVGQDKIGSYYMADGFSVGYFEIGRAHV